MGTETYDKFPINLLESRGPIKLDPIEVISDNINVWENGAIVKHLETRTSISLDNQFNGINYVISNKELRPYINLVGNFLEKSENKDRILLSTSLLSGGLGRFQYPDMLSLFYKNRQLAKLQFTIVNPSRIVEFFVSTIPDKVEKNPVEDDLYFDADKKDNFFIISIEDNNLIPDGRSLIIKANRVKEASWAKGVSAIFGKKYYTYSKAETPDTEIFVVPYSESFLKKLLAIVRKGEEYNFWTPNLSQFFDARIRLRDGTMKKMHKSYEFKFREK